MNLVMSINGCLEHLYMSDKTQEKYKALFLDRDGIINVDHGYVYKKEDFEFNEGIFALVKHFFDEGYLIFVVTNQSGIGRGYYSEEDFSRLTQWMIDVFKQKNISIEKVLYCPHTPHAKCSCRKPNTALIDEVLQQYKIDLSDSYLIGDKQSDIDLALNAGIKHAIYIGNKNIKNSTLNFLSIWKYKEYLENKDDLAKEIEAKIEQDPKVEIFSLATTNGRVWVKRARKTASNLLHKGAFFLTKNPIVVPVETKTAYEALQYEASKLQRLYENSIPVPKLIVKSQTYFVIEDCGQTVKYLLQELSNSETQTLLEKIIVQLATLHNANEYHGGSQVKNFTYKENKVYFIDFEESFPSDIDIKELQFRDLFLFLFSISKLNIKVDYAALIEQYITITGNQTVIDKFHTLTHTVSFLMKIVKNRIVWHFIDKDTKSIYRLLIHLENIPSHTGEAP